MQVLNSPKRMRLTHREQKPLWCFISDDVCAFLHCVLLVCLQRSDLWPVRLQPEVCRRTTLGGCHKKFEGQPPKDLTNAPSDVIRLRPYREDVNGEVVLAPAVLLYYSRSSCGNGNRASGVNPTLCEAALRPPPYFGRYSIAVCFYIGQGWFGTSADTFLTHIPTAGKLVFATYPQIPASSNLMVETNVKRKRVKYPVLPDLSRLPSGFGH